MIHFSFSNVLLHTLLSKLRDVSCCFHVLGRISFQSKGDFGEGEQNEELNTSRSQNALASAVFVKSKNKKEKKRTSENFQQCKRVTR